MMRSTDSARVPATARSVLRIAGRPEADGSEKSALAAYREMLKAEAKDDIRTAVSRLERSVEEKRKQIAQE